MRLIERIREQGTAVEQRYAIDDWLTQYLFPSTFQYGNTTYNFGMPGGLQTTMGEQRVKSIAHSLPGYTRALKSCPPAFAAQMVRALVLSQARFIFRNPPWHPTQPRRTFGTTDLLRLERPWPKATTGDMVGVMEWHEGLAGNSYVVRRPDRLRVLRPDWVGVLYGSELEPDHPDHALDGELIGYLYQNGGFSCTTTSPVFLEAADVAHWAPLPDPENPGMGMSWLTPGLRDIQADQAASEFKTKFLTNGATPNLVVKGIPAYNPKQFNDFVDMMEERHAGVANAFRTLYLVAGADATVVGANLQQLDLRNTQGGGETRLSMLSRVPAPVLGIAAGLEGSALNAGNFGQARRLFADTWVYPSLQNLAQSLEDIVDMPSRPVPPELWFDAHDIPLLKEDARDAAEIDSVRAQTVRTLVDGGYTPETAAAYAASGDLGVLKHTGLFSVQLQAPGSQQQPLAITSGGQS